MAFLIAFRVLYSIVAHEVDNWIHPSVLCVFALKLCTDPLVSFNRSLMGCIESKTWAPIVSVSFKPEALKSSDETERRPEFFWAVDSQR